MRKVLIIGAGQSGMQLALSLQAEQYDVTVMSARTPDEIRNGWPTSTQVMFDPALNYERAYHLNLWEHEAPHIPAVGISGAAEPGTRAFSFHGRWDPYAMSVDQRLKMPEWLQLFENRGGQVIYHAVMTSDLAGLSALYDLTIVAAGKGELVDLFDRDPLRSRHETPGRVLSAIYSRGMADGPEYPSGSMRISLGPGIGEVFSIPALSLSGPCYTTLVEAIPGGPLDIFRDRPNPAEHLRRLKQRLAEYMPWEAKLHADCEPADPRASLSGAFTGTIRQPVAQVGPASHLLGMADVVVVNDPIAGQGANNAAHCAGIYTKAILDRGDKPFDPEWMRDTFETFWQTRAQYSTRLTDVLLEGLPERAQSALAAAGQDPETADQFAGLFPYPENLGSFLGN